MNRAELVEENHPELSVRKQCELLGVSRSSVYYEKAPESREERAIMQAMDPIYMKDPCIGTRKLVTVLGRDYGLKVNRKRIQRLRREIGMETIWCQPRKPSTSQPEATHRKY